MPINRHGFDRGSRLVEWWKRLTGSANGADAVDYYQEGLDLQAEGHHHEALTSFRLALKESPGDALVLQQIAVSYTRIGMSDEAIKTYRHVIDKDPMQPGAHYGLAFLLIRRGHDEEAVPHLKGFLRTARSGPEADDHLAHARGTLADIQQRIGARSSATQSA